MDNNEIIPFKTPTMEVVPLPEILVNHAGNYRDDNEYFTPELIADIAMNGLHTPLVLHKEPNGKYKILRGNRRIDALTFLANPEHINPETKQPYVDPQTGKPFTSVKAQVYKNLSPSQQWALQFDHGTTRGLSKVGLVRAVWDAKDKMVPDKRVVTQGRALFEAYYKPKRELEDTEDARFNYWKGALAPIVTAWKGPTLVRDAYLAKIRGTQNWPRKKELNEAVNIYLNALANDKTNSINRDNPGPDFMAYWNKLLANVEEASGEDGEESSSPKKVSALARPDMEALKKVTDSRIAKTFISFMLRDLSQEGWSTFDKFLVSLEKAFTPEQTQALDGINQITPGAPVPETETAAA